MRDRFPATVRSAVDQDTASAQRESGSESDWPRRCLLLVLVALFTWAVLPTAYIAVQALRHHLVPTGEIQIGADQLQYLSWVRDLGTNGLAANHFQLGAAQHDFWHPMFFISGILFRLGVPIQWTLFAWTPVAVLVLFGGYWLYVRRLVAARRWLPVFTLAFALFFYPLASVLFTSRSLGFFPFLLGEDSSPARNFWGYIPSALAIGMMPLLLLRLESLVERDGMLRQRLVSRSTVLACALGAAISWMHPWQGATILVLLVALAAWDRGRRTTVLLAAPIVATLLPLAYYAVLGRLDASWRLSRAVDVNYPSPPAWLLLATIGPLVGFALLGVHGRATSFQERALRLWPLAVLALYLAPGSPYPMHYLQGVCLPLAVLAARAVTRLPSTRPIAVLGAVSMTVPGLAHAVSTERATVAQNGGQASEYAGFLITHDERSALAYLRDSRQAGGVFARQPFAFMVPVFSGRSTWVGHASWSPDFLQRVAVTDRLFEGKLTAAETRAAVRHAGARFVVSACAPGTAQVLAYLAPMTQETKRFGCVSVITLAGPS